MSCRIDCHVHLDKIGSPHRTRPPSPKQLIQYVKKYKLTHLVGIYDSPEIAERFRSVVPAKIFFFKWIRKPTQPHIEDFASGIKLHPYIDRYKFNRQNTEPTLNSAKQKALPILVHCDDRSPDLSRPRIVSAAAREFPGIDFIIGHSGSYAPCPYRTPRVSRIDRNLLLELVNEAVRASQIRPNAYLDTSILASRLKTDILVSAPEEKILIGTDFPISKNRRETSYDYQEQALLDAGMSLSALESVRSNLFRLLYNA